MSIIKSYLLFFLLNWLILISAPSSFAKEVTGAIATGYPLATEVGLEVLESIQKLEANIIQKISDGKRDKVYCAGWVLSILEEHTRISTES